MSASNSIVVSMRLPLDAGSVSSAWRTVTDGPPATPAPDWWRKACAAPSLPLSTFRDSPAGRHAYIQGSTLAVWEVTLLLRGYKSNVPAVARHLRWPEARVKAALNYADAFPEKSIKHSRKMIPLTSKMLKRQFPQAVYLFRARPFPRKIPKR